MRQYVITTDNNSDLPEAFYQEHGVKVINLSYIINDVIYDGVERSLSTKEFYQEVRNGAMPLTQQVNPENSRVFFSEIVKAGYDILHIAFSSGLSGTYNSCHLGAEEVMEEYPESKITVIDSLCASMGQGLLVVEAVKRYEAGMEYDTLIKWIENNKLRVAHEVVADDLFHLHRGGRISKASAVIGTTLGVKPIINVTDEGKLVSFAKQRHKSGGFKFLVSRMNDRMDVSDDLYTVGISHSDCLEDAQKIEKLIRENDKVKDVIISDIGPTIGSHTGAGTVAIFYFVNKR